MAGFEKSTFTALNTAFFEDGVFIGHSVTFINDSYPRATSNGCLQTETNWKVERTLVKKGASIGSGTTSALFTISPMMVNDSIKYADAQASLSWKGGALDLGACSGSGSEISPRR